MIFFEMLLGFVGLLTAATMIGIIGGLWAKYIMVPIVKWFVR